MKLDQLVEEWGKDVNIDRTELGDEALNIPKLHHKYRTLLIDEKLVLKNLKNKLFNLLKKFNKNKSKNHKLNLNPNLKLAKNLNLKKLKLKN